MKLWKLFALALALMLAVTATAFAYDGEVLTITADCVTGEEKPVIEHKES